MSREKNKKNTRRLPGLTIRFEAAIRRELEQVAAAEHRSLANLVEKIVVDYLEANKQEEKSNSQELAPSWPHTRAKRTRSNAALEN